MVPRESKELIKDMYGKTPAPIPKVILKKILGDAPQLLADLRMYKIDMNMYKFDMNMDNMSQNY